MWKSHFAFLLVLFTIGNVSGYRMPRFSWDTLPVAYHSSNTTGPIGMYSPESLKILAKFAVVTLEKYQGINGLFHHDGINWANCQNGTDVTLCGCCIEDNILAVGKAIKEIDPTTMVIHYWHSNKEYPTYLYGQKLCSNPDWWARDVNGEVVYGGTWVYWDHSQRIVSQEWARGCLAMTETGYIDGCFMDGCTKDECHQSYNPAYMEIKKETMVDLQTKVPGPLICGSNGHVLPGVAGSQIQNWGKQPHWSTREIPMLLKAVDAGIMFEAHGPCPKDATNPVIINNIAAFLIAAGPWSYYMCGTWTNAPVTWYPIYDMPLGVPLSNATLGQDGIWKRSFESGTKVTFDTKTEQGTIEWAASK